MPLSRRVGRALTRDSGRPDQLGPASGRPARLSLFAHVRLGRARAGPCHGSRLTVKPVVAGLQPVSLRHRSGFSGTEQQLLCQCQWLFLSTGLTWHAPYLAWQAPYLACLELLKKGQDIRGGWENSSARPCSVSSHP